MLLEVDHLIELTKTDFIQYLNCPKSLWVLKHESNIYPHGEFSTFMQKLTREGYEVERFAHQYFGSKNGRSISFQRTFKTDNGLFSRADAFETTSDGETILYEIKSSTRVKTDSDHNHIKDACFQKICAERSGQIINRVIIIHLNGKYVRSGEIDPSEFLVFTDVTEQVNAIVNETSAEIEAAIKLLNQNKICRNGCSCVYKSRAHHCDTFAMFNPNIPKLSIYSLPRLNVKKRADFVDQNIFDLRDIPDGYPLSGKQQDVLLAAKSGKPLVNLAVIKNVFADWLFPLYFFDFETFSSAIPLVDGASPHKHFPVQYSLHILEDNGTLTHKEFLQREPCLPLNLVEQMQSDIGDTGNIVAWHASFEKTQNREMTKLFPDKNTFLTDLNDRMVDLEDIFKLAYVDARFDGSTSIKKVLPVICPELSYKEMNVQDGASAMEAWQKMIRAEKSEAEGISRALLEYCKLDTFAMVGIFRFLRRLVSK